MTSRDTYSQPELLSRRGTALVAVLLFAACFLAGRASLLTALMADAIGLLWPASGFAVAALYRYGRGFAPAVFLAALAVHAGSQQWPVALGLALGDTSAILLCVTLLRSRPFSPRFNRCRDAYLLLVAAAAAMTLSAVNGATWLLGAGRIDGSQFFTAVALWHLGEFAGVILAAPFLLAAPIAIATLTSRSFLVSTLLLLALLSVTAFAPIGTAALLLAFLPFILIIRTASRHGLAAASLHLLLVLVVAMIVPNFGFGPARFVSPEVRHYAVWGYFVALGLAVLLTTGLIGERESVERRMLTGEENYKALVEDNPALIARFALDGRLAFANETFRRFLGVHKGMTAGANFLELTGTGSDPRFLQRLHTMRVGDPAVTTESVLTLEGVDHWIRWTARVVGESSGLGIEFHAVGLDVTEQKNAEAERRRIETQAVQAQKLEAVGSIAGGIAHEFNNLLTAMLAHLELAQATLPAESEAAAHVHDVQQGARRAAELTHQLLSFAGRRSLPPEPIDLAEVIRGAEDLFNVAVPKSCEVTLDVPEGLPLVAGDEVRLKQLLMCLMASAGEAVCETGGAVTLRVRPVNVEPKAGNPWRLKGVLEPGGHVLLQVEDRGIGMSPPVLARIFEPFFSARFPGRGLGLAAALGIARDYSGAIGVCSRPGLGTRVSVFFPALDAGAAGLAPEPVHAAECPYCQSQTHAFEETPPEGYPALPPFTVTGLSRSGYSSATRGRAAKFKAHEV